MLALSGTSHASSLSTPCKAPHSIAFLLKTHEIIIFIDVTDILQRVDDSQWELST